MIFLNNKPTIQAFDYRDVRIQVHRKKIKRMYLRIQPSTGIVRISCPLRTTQQQLQHFAQLHYAWIHHTKNTLQSLNCCNTSDFSNGSAHFYRGQRYLLHTTPSKKTSVLRHQTAIEIASPTPECNTSNQRLLEQWYRSELKHPLPSLIQHWEPIIGRQVRQWRIKKMKTRWGTCNPSAQRIWLNAELAKTPFQCWEYVLVHEMVHLLERSHNAVFQGYMDRFLPDWRNAKSLLTAYLIG